MITFSGSLHSSIFIFDTEDILEVQVVLHGSTRCRKLNTQITDVLFYS